jgi:histidyl-tRNA synthetase
VATATTKKTARNALAILAQIGLNTENWLDKAQQKTMKPSTPKGTRDFSPAEMARRNYIFDTVKAVFRTHGFSQIETPAMETSETLMGKYGEEGDRLIFKILNSGDYLKDVADLPSFATRPLSLVPLISEKALRYDLTVPFARYVVQHRNDLTFPFKRFQIQPVWRADRPQKGRYREFYQCDVDVIGSDSLLNEVELVQIIDSVFGKLNVPVTLKLNNRKLLAAIAQVVGAPDAFVDITVALDKLDKIGEEKVVEELKQRNISDASVEKLLPLIRFQGDTQQKLDFLAKFLGENELGKKGIAEVQTVISTSQPLISSNTIVELDLTLARGLNYYTGAIFEVKSNLPNTLTSTICGGGRYDDLTGIFGLPNVSGVGISFGADRIYDVLLEAGLFPDSAQEGTQVLFTNFGESESLYCLPMVKAIREAGISVELFPESGKMKKQLGYADNLGIPFVAMVGESEMNADVIALKNMKTGEQVSVTLAQLIAQLKGK